MKYNNPIILAILAVSFMGPLPLVAEEPGEIPRQAAVNSRAAAHAANLAKYDSNGNGKLDPEEIKTMARERLLEADRNGDGKVDWRELTRPRATARKMAPQDALQRAIALEEALLKETELLQEKRLQREQQSREAPSPK